MNNEDNSLTDTKVHPPPRTKSPITISIMLSITQGCTVHF